MVSIVFSAIHEADDGKKKSHHLGCKCIDTFWIRNIKLVEFCSTLLIQQLFFDGVSFFCISARYDTLIALRFTDSFCDLEPNALHNKEKFQRPIIRGAGASSRMFTFIDKSEEL
jgi:hypothetical protein